MSTFRVLIVDDDKQWSKNTTENLKQVTLAEITGEPHEKEMHIEYVTNQLDANRAIEKNTLGYDLILLDLLYPLTPNEAAPEVGQGEFAGMKWLPELRRLQPNATIMIITAYPNENYLRNVVDAISRDHANDFVPKRTPFRDLKGRVRLAVASQRRLRTLRMFENEFHSLFRSRAASVLADDIGRLIDRNSSELIRIAQNVESGDPTSIANAPGDIRGLCRSLHDRYSRMTSFFSTIGEHHLREMNLTSTISQMLLLCTRRFEETGAKVIAPTNGNATKLTTFESDIRIALHEVLWNAADALKDCRTPLARRTLEVRIAVDLESKRATISVLDNGGGFPDEVLAHIFEPHTSTHHDDRHHGLGLYIAKHMMQAVGGNIQVKNREEGGAEVVLTIPDLSKSAPQQTGNN